MSAELKQALIEAAVEKARTDFYAFRAPEEFYDRSADRFEHMNLIESPAHQAQIESLRAELRAMMQWTEDPFAEALANRGD